MIGEAMSYGSFATAGDVAFLSPATLNGGFIQGVLSRCLRWVHMQGALAADLN